MKLHTPPFLKKGRGLDGPPQNIFVEEKFGGTVTPEDFHGREDWK
jgi:hypothetical protein